MILGNFPTVNLCDSTKIGVYWNVALLLNFPVTFSYVDPLLISTPI